MAYLKPYGKSWWFVKSVRKRGKNSRATKLMYIDIYEDFETTNRKFKERYSQEKADWGKIAKKMTEIKAKNPLRLPYISVLAWEQIKQLKEMQAFSNYILYKMKNGYLAATNGEVARELKERRRKVIGDDTPLYYPEAARYSSAVRSALKLTRRTATKEEKEEAKKQYFERAKDANIGTVQHIKSCADPTCVELAKLVKAHEDGSYSPKLEKEVEVSFNSILISKGVVVPEEEVDRILKAEMAAFANKKD